MPVEELQVERENVEGGEAPDHVVRCKLRQLKRVEAYLLPSEVSGNAQCRLESRVECATPSQKTALNFEKRVILQLRPSPSYYYMNRKGCGKFAK